MLNKLFPLRLCDSEVKTDFILIILSIDANNSFLFRI